MFFIHQAQPCTPQFLRMSLDESELFHWNEHILPRWH